MKTVKTILACALSACLLGEVLLLRTNAIGLPELTPEGMQKMIEYDELAPFDDSGLVNLGNMDYGDYAVYAWKGKLEQPDLWAKEGFWATVFYLQDGGSYLELYIPWQADDEAYNTALTERVTEIINSCSAQERVLFYPEKLDGVYYNSTGVRLSEEMSRELVARLQAENLVLRAQYVLPRNEIRYKEINYNLLQLCANDFEQDVNLLYPRVQEYLAEHYPNISVTPGDEAESVYLRHLDLHVLDDDIPTLEEMCAIAVEIYEACDCRPFSWIFASAGSSFEIEPYREYVLYAQDAMLGDLDYDGVLGVADAVLMARAVAEDSTVLLSEQAYQNADYNEDGLVDAGDLTALLGTIAGLNQSA